MGSITQFTLSEDFETRFQELADREGRSLNQQAIFLLERAVAEESMGFERAYRRFRETHGPSPLKDGDLDGLRSG